MKVRLFKEKPVFRFGWRPEGHREVPLLAVPPFYYSPFATRAHRIRSGRMYYRDGVYSHTALLLWCGQSGHPSKRGWFLEQPNVPVCATCEGRAIGAGQLDSHSIAGQFVVFSPRV